MDTNVNHYTKKELAAIENFMPQEIFNAVVIVPTGKNHDSGFGAMKFILCRNFKIVGCVSGWSDVLHINGIGGYGKEDLNMQKRVAWCIDCLPKSKCVRLFCFDHFLDIDDEIYSDFSLYVGEAIRWVRRY